MTIQADSKLAQDGQVLSRALNHPGPAANFAKHVSASMLFALQSTGIKSSCTMLMTNCHQQPLCAEQHSAWNMRCSTLLTVCVMCKVYKSLQRLDVVHALTDTFFLKA